MANRKNSQIIGKKGSIILPNTKFYFVRTTRESKNGQRRGFHLKRTKKLCKSKDHRSRI